MSKLTLVAGAGGFIGGHLVRALLEQNISVRAVDKKPTDAWYFRSNDVENIVADLQELKACERAAKGTTTIYNLAADMGGMGFIENNKALCMLSVLINTHMLMAAQKHGVERFFYSSSACVYPGYKQTEADVVALKESDAYPADAEDGYGWEKLFSERMCRHFREDFGLKTRVARYHNVYGPYGTWDGGREKAPAAISRKGRDGGHQRQSRHRNLGRRRADPQLHVYRRLPDRHAETVCTPTSKSRSISAATKWSRSISSSTSLRKLPASSSSVITSSTRRKACAAATATIR